mmetsp:Transcript_6750/g.8798  ORF Transcript_6750/g.8798 Transcript_6750/m.8798 type:complete len:105 (+) Transcript_6750:55-369(+)
MARWFRPNRAPFPAKSYGSLGAPQTIHAAGDLGGLGWCAALGGWYLLQGDRAACSVADRFLWRDWALLGWRLLWPPVSPAVGRCFVHVQLAGVIPIGKRAAFCR